MGETVSLFLRRPHLRDLPPVLLPPGYRLRVAQDSTVDQGDVGKVLAGAFPDKDWSLEKTRERLWDDTTVACVYLVHDAQGNGAATASVRVMPEQHPGSGYVHWVGASPDHRGKGLGYAVTLATLHEFVRRGLTDAVLETDDFRIPAIRIYLGLGFMPEMRDPWHALRWKAIADAHPNLTSLRENQV